MLRPRLIAALCRPRAVSLPLRSISGQSRVVSEEQIAQAVTAWQDSAAAGTAPPLRFPIGTPVRCFAGSDGWLRGTVVAHQYRESSWAAELPTVPYQVLLDSENGAAGEEPSAIWAPADVEEIVRASFRFELEDVVDGRVAQDEWVRCTVVGRYYREADWEEGSSGLSTMRCLPPWGWDRLGPGTAARHTPASRGYHARYRGMLCTI